MLAAGRAEAGARAAQEARERYGTGDASARLPVGLSGRLLIGIAVVWSLFQLWIASPLPYIVRIGVFNATEARSIHLTFAMALAFLSYGARSSSPRNTVPVLDWLLAAVGAFCALYIFLFQDQLALRPGAPLTHDVVIGIIGLLVLLEATRRALGPPLMIIASVFLLYSLAGPWMPGLLAHRGVSLAGLVNHQWISTQGVFGIALGVSTSFVFLFVLFGALLAKAGAGNYFIQVAFAALGHYRGGPAKAAVVGSAFTGVISGSSIANTVTTGTFTIPMMKRVGFSPDKAGAVEVSSSINGQLMPPVMGAAAFLMVEYVGIPYVDIIRHALLPAIISYIALFYLVHLEALKSNLPKLERSGPNRTVLQRLLGFLGGLISFMILAALVYYGLGWLKPVLGNAAGWAGSALLVVAYLALLRLAASQPLLEEPDPSQPGYQLPRLVPTLLAGLHFVLPVVVLLWCLMIERFSPGLSAYWATVIMICIMLTQRPLLAWLRNERGLVSEAVEGVREVWDGLVIGARNMVGIGIATAAAGIIVGAVSQTGIGLVLADVVETVAMGNLMLILVFTAFLCLILGLGLPTTANYIVVSALLAPVVVQLGEQNGLLVPLIAVHLFVFYFGLMADATPPVGLAAFAAAAISGGDPIRTGTYAFFYSMRTAVMPFLFIFNTDLLLIDVTWWQGILVFLTATAGMLMFAAATQGYMLVRSRWYESLILVLVAFTLVRPGFWMDRIQDPWRSVPPTEFVQVLGELEEGNTIRLEIEGFDAVGNPQTIWRLVPVPAGATGEDRLAALGLELFIDGDQVMVDHVAFGSPAEEMGFVFDDVISTVEAPVHGWAKEWMWIPALLLFAVIWYAQRRRRTSQAALDSVVPAHTSPT